MSNSWMGGHAMPPLRLIVRTTPPHPNDSTDFSENQTATKDSVWRFKNGWNVNESAACGVVMDWNGEENEEGDTDGDHGTPLTDAPVNKAAETHRIGKAEPMPKCIICGTSIPTERVPGVPIEGGLAYRSCVEHRWPGKWRR
ncbi:MAG: hypothetical protein R3F54_31735 [Alphaproteobacteria bacterium]